MAIPSPTTGAPTPPRHIAIIMDGNGRWAKSRGLPRVAGHKRGASVVRSTVEAAVDLGLEYLTLFAFSSENWSRPVQEVDDLMGLLRHFIKRELDELLREGVRIRVLGRRERLPGDIVALIEDAEAKTARNNRLNLTLAINYGGRQEIVDAARDLAKLVKDGAINPSDISEELFGGYLGTKEIPDPDLIIRTSGDHRISNFLLWQAAYSELHFPELFWPDFKRSDLEEAINIFLGRERRYGGLGS